MFPFLRQIVKIIPTLLLSIALAVAVWISAVTASDPVEERSYPLPVALEIIGQDPGLVITSEVPNQLSLVLKAPSSIWDKLINEPAAVRALVDLSGQRPGPVTLPVNVQVSLRPVEIKMYTPRSITLTLEVLSSRVFPIRLIRQGEPAIGFQMEEPVLGEKNVTISGPSSLVNRVQDVIATLTVGQAHETIKRTLLLQTVDANEQLVSGLSISPDRVLVEQAITQRGGYRNLVVKAIVIGQIGRGYRVTNISVFPPAITVFSNNPTLVSSLPGYVETTPLDLKSARDDIDVRLSLNLPAGVSVVGEPNVQVQVGIAAIEGSLTVVGRKVVVTGLQPGFAAKVSPETVDVILSGPLPMLEKLEPADVRVIVDMAGQGIGVFQRLPRVSLLNSELIVDSILPSSLEVTITIAPTPIPTPTPKR